MADLGNLSFSVFLKDRTQSDYEKIRENLRKMNLDLNPKLSPKIDKSSLTKDIRSALKEDFKINIVIDKAKAREAVKEALIKAGVANNITTSDVRAQRIKEIEARMAQNAAINYQKLARAQVLAEKATKGHTTASEALGKSLSSNSRLASEIGNQFANLYSILTIERFIKGLIEIGGEFQKQRIALTSIIGDSSKAESIFQRIKKLAVESPFEFRELASYTKQLAAYNIPYEELYDTTKRLADISAGVGVDMGRIILAYGQVRSAAFLRGQELRQFTEAGIPLVQALADKFSILENRVISAGEVIDKVSRREVSFDMVKDVLWELTNEGGKFYNMQEALAESLAGKWSNLKDSWDVMMADIAESNNGVLGSSIDILTNLMEHWREFATILSVIISAYGAVKVSMIAVNVLQKSNIAIKYIMNLARAIQGLSAATKAQAIAQGALNVIMKANPLYVIAGAIGTILALYLNLHQNIKTVKEVTSQYNNELEEQNEKINAVKNSANGYVTAMFNAATSIDEKRKAYEKLQSIYPSIFKNMEYEQALLKGEASLRETVTRASMTEAKDKSQIAYENALMKLFEAQEKFDNVSIAYERHPGQTKDAYERAKSELENAKELVKLTKDTFLQNIKTLNDIKKNVESKWFTTASDIAKRTGLDILKPDESLGYEAYVNKLKEAYSESKSIIENFREGNEFSEDKVKKAKNTANAIKLVADALGFVVEKQGKEDPVAEEWKKRIDLIEKAIQSFNKWREIEGKDAAEARIRSNEAFKPLFDESGINLDLEDPRKAYQYIINKLNNTEKQKELSVSLGIKIGNSEIDKAKENVEKALLEIQNTIERSSKKWDLYKRLFETTGNKEQAMNIVFGGTENLEKGVISYVEELKRLLKKYTGDIDINSLINSAEKGVTEKELVDKFKDSGKIIKSLLDEIVKANQVSNEEEEKIYIDSLANTMDYYQKKQKIIEDYARQIEIAQKKGDANTVNKLESKRDAELIQIDPQTLLFYSSILSFTKQQAIEVGNNLKQGLVKQLENGTISANEFCETTEKINNLLDKSNKRMSAFASYMNGGTEGLLSWFNDIGNAKVAKGSIELEKANADLTKYADAFEEAMSKGDEAAANVAQNGMNTAIATKEAATNTIQMGKGMQGFASGAQGALFIVDQIVKAVDQTFKAMQQIVDSVAELAESRGIDTDSGKWANVKGYMNMLSDFNKYTKASWDSFKSGDAAGAVANTVSSFTSIFTNLNKLHDKKLDKTIQKSQFEVKKLENAYKNLQSVVERQLGNVTESQTQDMISNLQKQREELEKQRQSEEDKKDSDNDKIEDYKQQMHELDEQLKYFYEDLAKDLYSIDLKDWASQFSESLIDAWRNGEDAAEAFGKTASDILADVANDMIRMAILEPALNELRGKIPEMMSDGTLNDSELSEIAQYLLKIQDKYGESVEYLDELEKKINEATGGSLSIKNPQGNADSLSKNIQGVTEDTANLLGSYLNSIRQDSSIKRNLMEKLMGEILPQYNVVAEAQTQQLRIIAQNTERNAMAAEDIRDLFNRVIDRGNNRIRI